MSSARARVSGSVLVGVLLLVGLVIAMPASAAGTPRATGAGTTEELGETSTFTFNAVQHKSGTVNGHLVYHVRGFDLSIHMDIDCLTFIGNQAVLSGTVTKVRGDTEPFPFIFVGQDGVFQVEDNGQGGGAPPDLISDVDLDAGLNCNNTVLTPYLPISGNIQVNP
jgi:hypothetical protein